MPDHIIRARQPEPSASPRLGRDPDMLASFLEDAAHFPGGFAAGIATPASEAEVAALIRSVSSVLPIGAQSSLTGGATPRGEVLLGTGRLNRILGSGDDWVRVEAGVTLVDLDAALADLGKYYPPVPTFTGAFAGGTVATNAAGAATFKYGTTRDWVRALTVVLASGEVLDLERGRTQAHADGFFEIVLSDRALRVPLPRYRMPEVPKSSAGYFAAPGMDLIDLFIGSEGTLGVITEVTLRVLPARPQVCLAFVPFDDRARALAFVAGLRDAARETWRARDPRGLDVSAIEHMDGRCLALLREDGADRINGVTIPADTVIGLLITLELPANVTSSRAFDEIGRAREPHPPDTPLVRFCSALDDAGVLDRVEIAVPGDAARERQLLALREAVPAGVNARVGRAKLIDARIAKTAADMIVPFARLDELLTIYDQGFRARGLDAAVWGHISDGNLHPNVIPRSMAELESGKAAILAFGREVIRMGGSPLAEHGVGRNPVKQQLLVELYGTDGVEQMRAVKRSLDPGFKLAPGVIFG
ncbi:MAG TPA: FAD-binding oxidoreductase [Vicinamibacterales bacterium]|jgi:D-lactate dehydrogenase (cytochrome)|nr:FAD-binding oxidoreductase [Vicinamibacterales bacterium]